jgi:hypothetical protein
MNRHRLLAAAFAMVAPVAALLLTPARARAGAPPPELRQLEREVSLKLAHTRDLGPTDPHQREQLYEAAQLDSKAEKEIAAGDFKSAEDDLVRANAILGRLGP